MKEGKTPLQIAEEREKKDIIRFISKFEKSSQGEKTNQQEEEEEVIEDVKNSFSSRREPPAKKSENGFSPSRDNLYDSDSNHNASSALDQSTNLTASNGVKKSFLYSSWIPISLLVGVTLVFGAYHFVYKESKENSYETQSSGDKIIIEEKK